MNNSRKEDMIQFIKLFDSAYTVSIKLVSELRQGRYVSAKAKALELKSAHHEMARIIMKHANAG